jgi:acyl phosphate:glycerol-3-phosphate acyltransferase
MDFLSVILAAAGGYLLGSIPFGLVIVKAAGLGDIRSLGSGNIGATNVLRTGRKDLALATLLLDSGKAAAALAIARALFGPEAGWIAGAAAFVGHCFPVWLGFKGGKGVATFFGTLLVGAWPVGVMAGLLWLMTAFTFRFSSLGALVAAVCAPLIGAVFHVGPVGIGALVVMGALIFWRHQENIRRLLKGEEPKIGAKKTAEAEAEA